MEKKRARNMVGCLSYTPRLGIEPTTQACVLNQTHDLLLCGMAPSKLSHTSWGLLLAFMLHSRYTHPYTRSYTFTQLTHVHPHARTHTHTSLKLYVQPPNPWSSGGLMLLSLSWALHLSSLHDRHVPRGNDWLCVMLCAGPGDSPEEHDAGCLLSPPPAWSPCGSSRLGVPEPVWVCGEFRGPPCS